MPKLALDYQRYRVPQGGDFRLASIASDEDQGLSRKRARKKFRANLEALDQYQERLYAEGRQSLLLVLQAMDTAGKDSTIRKIAGDLNPQGCRVWNFKVPSAEELDHDFLWRVHDHVPPKGYIGIFNRSHYEDVLIARVHGLATEELIAQRYQHINDFERLLFDHGTRVIKIMLHISKEYQRERLQRRVDNPDKHWKFNPGDLQERKRWNEYMRTYELMLNRCSTDYAPWYVVPAEQRWFRNLVVSQILCDALQQMNPTFPPPEFDPQDYPPGAIR